jgi:hypothetical protein
LPAIYRAPAFLQDPCNEVSSLGIFAALSVRFLFCRVVGVFAVLAWAAGLCDRGFGIIATYEAGEESFGGFCVEVSSQKFSDQWICYDVVLYTVNWLQRGLKERSDI